MSEPALERGDVLAMMEALLDIQWKLDQVLLGLFGDDDGEEEES